VVSYRKDTKLRKTYDKAFKTKVVLEALKEELTLQELGQKYDVHPESNRTVGKSRLSKRCQIFSSGPNKKSASERESEDREEQMLKTIGTQKIEIDWLKKKYRQLYGRDPN
jgi:transposase